MLADDARTTITRCSDVRERIEAAFKGLNGNNPATSCANLVNFRPTIFTLIKRAMFAAICHQFEDDLHSSPLHSETDWNIAIFISAMSSAIISVHLVEIW